MSTKFIKDPHEVVKAGQVVKVKVIETDVKRQRISLTMRLDDDSAQASASGGAGGAQSRGSQDRRSGQRPQQRREPEAAGAMAAAFAKLKR
jgi:uncharacterized protein